MGRLKIEHKILCGKSEEKRPLGKHRHTYNNYIKIDIREMQYENVGKSHAAVGAVQWQYVFKNIMKPGSLKACKFYAVGFK